ncbi:hypothetical protein G4H71_13470 [Rhodococcus triatomae]|uniref:hypothetical protein n=1 Tax=Rhodococcus triatomae TaxID=300028 RepID=UPI0009F9416F|nr:hypothetical protein [Rhodococcus triatomae]QNG20186.1 hypothetical protein G4H72_16905 [Rhodococcus triatomae]QNG23898.1 hypothetical protein G4H71_13470 [Rhodococcus triatomae]
MSEQKPLRLDEGAIEELVGMCDAILANVRTAMRQAAGLNLAGGFGGFDSAKQLEAGYKRKGADGEDSVHARLAEFEEAIVAMRDAFEAGGDAYADQESVVMQKIALIAGEISS